MELTGVRSDQGITCSRPTSAGQWCVNVKLFDATGMGFGQFVHHDPSAVNIAQIHSQNDRIRRGMVKQRLNTRAGVIGPAVDNKGNSQSAGNSSAAVVGKPAHIRHRIKRWSLRQRKTVSSVEHHPAR